MGQAGRFCLFAAWGQRLRYIYALAAKKQNVSRTTAENVPERDRGTLRRFACFPQKQRKNLSKLLLDAESMDGVQ